MLRALSKLEFILKGSSYYSENYCYKVLYYNIIQMSKGYRVERCKYDNKKFIKVYSTFINADGEECEYGQYYVVNITGSKYDYVASAEYSPEYSKQFNKYTLEEYENSFTDFDNNDFIVPFNTIIDTDKL